MAEKEEGEKTGKGRRTHQVDSMAGTPDHASTKTKIDRDVIVQLSSSSSATSSKRSSTDSFSKPNFAKLLVLQPQLCQALGQLCNSPFCMVFRAARHQLGALFVHGGHFLLQLSGELTTAPTDVDWHWEILVEASSCPLRQMSRRLAVAQPGS